MSNQLIAGLKNLDYVKAFCVAGVLMLLIFLESSSPPFKNSYFIWIVVLSFSGSIFFIGKLLGFVALDGLTLYLTYFAFQFFVTWVFFKILRVKSNKIILATSFFGLNLGAYWLAWFIPGAWTPSF